jgi:hypothetical protein
MARKKRISFGERLGHVFSDFADAASVAATGSQLGILERAAEDEIAPPAVERARAARKKRKAKAVARKRKVPQKKKAASKKSRAPKGKKRAARRR